MRADGREHRVRASARVGVVALATATMTVTALLFTPAGAVERPTEWDTRLVPLVAEVERLRGLGFDHPVVVEFLAPAKFERRVAIDRDELDADDTEDLERSEASLRAVGLVAGDVDLLESTSDLREAGVLAYYDPKRERISVRGTDLDVSTRVVLAHELTHALQDQHFDLEAMERRADRARASSSFRALVEGDARRIETAYLDSLPSDERVEYEERQGASLSDLADGVGSDAIPAALIALFQSPYALGPEMLRFVMAADDGAVVDELFEHQPTSDLSYLDPRSLLDERKPVTVPTPTLGDGERRIGPRRDVFGAFALYLVLATAGDPVAALAAADGWGGDAMITFTRDGTTCVRATFAGADAADSQAIVGALGAWAAAHPGASTEAGPEGTTTLTSCDQGAATVDPGTAPTAALVMVGLRNALLAQGAEQVGAAAASCVVDRVLTHPSFEAFLAAAVADPTAEPDPGVSGPVVNAMLGAVRECSSG